MNLMIYKLFTLCSHSRYSPTISSMVIPRLAIRLNISGMVSTKEFLPVLLLHQPWSVVGKEEAHAASWCNESLLLQLVECFKHCVAVNSHSHSKLADRRYLFSREPLPFENKSAGIVHNLTVYRPVCSELAHSCLFFIR